MTKRAAIYLRVSTKEQNTANQKLRLEEVARLAGWKLIAIFEDAGVSGSRGRDQRPQFDAALKAAARRDYDVLMAWSVDRLGRSLQHLVTTLNELHALDIDLYIDQQAIDTTTPSGRAMFQMLGVFAEFEREMLKERIMAGLARAKSIGTKTGKPIGRPGLPLKKRRAISASLEAGMPVEEAAYLHKVGITTVRRIKRSAR